MENLVSTASADYCDNSICTTESINRS